MWYGSKSTSNLFVFVSNLSTTCSPPSNTSEEETKARSAILNGVEKPKVTADATTKADMKNVKGGAPKLVSRFAKALTPLSSAPISS
jgi:hypothetical protein